MSMTLWNSGKQDLTGLVECNSGTYRLTARSSYKIFTLFNKRRGDLLLPSTPVKNLQKKSLYEKSITFYPLCFHCLAASM
jgi:hypothetical protein